MKNQLNSVFKWIVGGGVLCVFLILPELWISKLITQNKSEAFETSFTTMFFLTICAYIAISTTKFSLPETMQAEMPMSIRLQAEANTAHTSPLFPVPTELISRVLPRILRSRS